MQSKAGLRPLLSVLAVALVNAREAARRDDRAGRPAADYFDPLGVAVLSVWRYRLGRPLAVRGRILEVARLGGHPNRKCDGMPGWVAIGRGAMQLRALVE